MISSALTIGGRVRARAVRMRLVYIVGLIAVLLLIAPTTSRAAISMIGAPIQNPRQVTISWNSPQAGSELRWDTERHVNFDDFPSTTPYDVSNPSGTPGRHSRTIADLPAGTYWYMVRSGSDVAGPFALELTAQDAGSWQVANLIPGNLDRSPARIDQTTFAPAGADPDTGKLWMSGSFDRVGRASPPAISVNDTGATEPGSPVISGGEVEVATEDGTGGWYVGGSFTHVAGIPMKGVAHILPDGGLDTSFAPTGVDASGTVYALERDAINTPPRLYVGGRFDAWSNPGGASTPEVHNLVAINPTTGARLANGDFNVGLGTTGATDAAPGVDRYDLGEVRAIVADQRPASGARDTDNAGVYIGGRFTKVGGAAFAKVAKLEPNGAPSGGLGECVGNAFLCMLGEALFAKVDFHMPGMRKAGSQQDAVVYSLA